MFSPDDPTTPLPSLLRAPWWLRVASASPRIPQRTIAERELARRSDLIAWLSLGLLIATLSLSLIALDDAQALIALSGIVLGLALAIAANRAGLVTVAGILVVCFIAGGIWAYMLSSPLGLTMGQLPNYDLLAVTVVVAASVLPRLSAFIVATINCAAIIADYFLRPHNANVVADAALYSSVTQQTISLLVRPLVLNLLLAVVAYLWVRGTDLAIRRADRAEEIAAYQGREIQRTAALEEGVRYLHQTLASWAEGDFRHRVPPMPLPVLEQVRHDLNLFISLFTSTDQTGIELRRLQGEAHRLQMALDGWLRHQPVAWPPPSGTALDGVISALEAAGVARPVSGPYRGSLGSRPSGPSGPIPPSRLSSPPYPGQGH